MELSSQQTILKGKEIKMTGVSGDKFIMAAVHLEEVQVLCFMGTFDGSEPLLLITNVPKRENLHLWFG